MQNIACALILQNNLIELTAQNFFICRCLELAEKGAGYVAPNPMVGAVLAYHDRIIGEGWHRLYGEPHAEVNCFESVKEEDRRLIAQSTLYVSLEPCAHFGKTPPCADLIIQHKVPTVVIGCRDPFPSVNGRGIEKLLAAGIEVFMSRYEEPCIYSNRRFFCFNTLKRPYIILKWAQTSDGIIGSGTEERLQISNEYTNRMVHRWRSEEASILVGANTALLDNPALDNRFWNGPSPVRILLDSLLKIPVSHKLYSSTGRLIVFNYMKQEETGNILYQKISSSENVISQIMKSLYELKILSVMVEGGSATLQSFIHEGCWDEARVIVNDKSYEAPGVMAPNLYNATLNGDQRLLTDTILYYKPVHGA